MQRYPQPVYSWHPPPGYPHAQQPYSPQALGVAPNSHKRAARVQQACDHCRMRKRRCDAMQPCDHCLREGHECLYTRSPNLKDDKLVNLIGALADKLEHVSETVRRVDRAHRTTHQLLFNELKEQNPTPNDHRTPAHNLIFLWPSVHAVLDAAYIDIREDYVAKAEDRPLLDPYARSQDVRAPSEQPRHHRIAMPPRAASVPHTQNRRDSGSQESSPASEGGLKPDGSLDLDRSTLESLLSSYFLHMHILHPFLDKRRLRIMFDAFTERFSDRPPTADTASDASSLFSHSRKRKRFEYEDNASLYDTNNVYHFSSQRERTENAIVWLVLALGKICLHKGPLPEAFDGSLGIERIFSQSSSGDGPDRDMSSSPEKSVPTSAPAEWPGSVHGESPPGNPAVRSSEEWREHPSAFFARNLDAVPGLAYYTKATETLGIQVDGNDLAHAQMFLLAGLYKGQLARVRESMSWITKAGRAIRLLLDREGLGNKCNPALAADVRKLRQGGQSRTKDAYQDSIVLTAWTCLQLESDILAELRFPSSDVPALELMPYDIPDCGIETHQGDVAEDTAYSHDTVVLSYSAQTFLRTKLNQVHREIYGNSEADHSSPHQIREMLRAHDLILTEWRTQLPPSLRWEDHDPPSANILHARLRAKYWGARYIITRPFLDYVMHIMPYIGTASDVEHIAKDARGDARDPAEVRLLEAIAGMPRSQVWAAVEACVQAAMQSTLAFDGIPDRLVVTNIHGTAHAQFGNMLVLVATYRHDRLKGYVPGERLCYLLDRTIAFLGRLGPISPTCKADCWILQRIRQWLFPSADPVRGAEGGDDSEHVGSESSFGSTIAVGPRADPRPGVSASAWG